MDKLVEHYGIVLGESTIRRITEGHAQKIFETGKAPLAWPTQPGDSVVVIVEMDGGMVPIVEPDTTQSNQRKGKKLQWKEAMALACAACRSQAPFSRMPSQGADRKRIFEASWPGAIGSATVDQAACWALDCQ